MQYKEWMEEGKQEVVRRSLRSVVACGLQPPHHFYMTFRTQFPGVQMLDSLRQHYPEEMTIVLNDAFWDLSVQNDFFSVDLLFEHKKNTLRIPFNSLVNFIDPGVEFALQFDWELSAPALSTSNVIFMDQFRQSL